MHSSVQIIEGSPIVTIRWLPFACFATTMFVLGCGTATPPPQAAPSSAAAHDHDHEHGAEHDHGAKSHAAGGWATTVQELIKLQTEIKGAFAADKEAEADAAVHEVGHLLEELEALVGKTVADPAAKIEVTQAIQTLFDAFGKIDAKLHGGAGASYAEVGEQIETAMATLAKQAPAEKAAP
jgi:hypothetical protein